jgi:xyloglucan fucosyltransferase
MEAKKVAEELADAKRGSWPAVSGVLAVVVLAVLVLSGRNAGAPVAWVQTAAASFRQGEVLFSVSALHFVSSSNVLCRGSIE